MATSQRLAPWSPRATVSGWRDGRGFVGDVRRDDVISIHWGWACDGLGADQVTRLIGWTQRHIDIANSAL